jgi:hypothetical protein
MCHLFAGAVHTNDLNPSGAICLLKLCTQIILVHLSGKLKQDILIGRCPSSVRLSVNVYIFDFFSRTAGSILTKLCTGNPWGGFKFVQMKEISPLQGEIIAKE